MAQGEVIDHMSLVAAIPEIGDVVLMRKIGLRNEQDMRRHHIKHGAQELDNAVGLRQMHAGRSNFLHR